MVAVFAFCSLDVWVATPARERQARDRPALLKAVAENPGENARLVLEALREEEERRAKRRDREERRGTILGGLIVVTVGVGLGVMLAILGDHAGAWSVGLIPFLIGCVLLGAGVFAYRSRASSAKGTHQSDRL